MFKIIKLHLYFIRYHLKDVIVGKIYFLLVRIKIKHMEIDIIKRETTGTGPSVYHENDTIAKYEIMDGAPVRGKPHGCAACHSPPEASFLTRPQCLFVLGESIPIRLFLAGYDLTPTMRDINKKFSVRYYLNLVLIDEEERRYFKQQVREGGCYGGVWLTSLSSSFLLSTPRPPFRKSRYGGKATWWGRACPIRPPSPLSGSRGPRLRRARWSRPQRKRAGRASSPPEDSSASASVSETPVTCTTSGRSSCFCFPPPTHGHSWDEEGRLTWTLEQFAWGVPSGFRLLVCHISLIFVFSWWESDSVSHFVTQSLSCEIDLIK